jgi:anti-anti-sigma factor
MTIPERTCGPVTVISPSGRIDVASSEDFSAQLTAALSRGGVLVVDMAAVEYISSVGLRALMVASKQVKASPGCQLAVASLQPVVEEIFAISRFNLVVQIFATPRDAVAALAPESVAAWDALAKS